MDEFDIPHTKAPSRFTFPTRLEYFLKGEYISEKNWYTVGICIICEAGRMVSKIRHIRRTRKLKS